MFDIVQSIDTGSSNAACVVSLSGISRQIILDALNAIVPVYRWYPVPTDTDTAAAAIDNAINEVMTSVSLIPVGLITAYAAQASIPAVPDGWLVCNGAAILTADYPLLSAAIGGLYGTAPSDYFRLPDLRDRFLYGTDTGQISLPSGGATTVTLSAANMPPHTHTLRGSTGSPFYTFSGTGSGRVGDLGDNGLNAAATRLATDSAGGSAGAATPFNILPPYVRVYFMIRATA